MPYIDDEKSRGRIHNSNKGGLMLVNEDNIAINSWPNNNSNKGGLMLVNEDNIAINGWDYGMTPKQVIEQCEARADVKSEVHACIDKIPCRRQDHARLVERQNMLEQDEPTRNAFKLWLHQCGYRVMRRRGSEHWLMVDEPMTLGQIEKFVQAAKDTNA